MKTLLRLEGAFLALAGLTVYHLTGGDWRLFALLILVPDLSMLGYLRGPRIGAWCYNAVHSWIAPVALYLAGLAAGSGLTTHLALILAVHIGVDRALGFGLKHESGFRNTHLS